MARWSAKSRYSMLTEPRSRRPSRFHSCSFLSPGEGLGIIRDIVRESDCEVFRHRTGVRQTLIAPGPPP